MHLDRLLRSILSDIPPVLNRNLHSRKRNCHIYRWGESAIHAVFRNHSIPNFFYFKYTGTDKKTHYSAPLIASCTSNTTLGWRAIRAGWIFPSMSIQKNPSCPAKAGTLSGLATSTSGPGFSLCKSVAFSVILDPPMDRAKTKSLIYADEAAVEALSKLTKSGTVAGSGTPEDARIEAAIKDCEKTRRAVEEDLRDQLRER
jgi:hypothetical protein